MGRIFVADPMGRVTPHPARKTLILYASGVDAGGCVVNEKYAISRNGLV